MKKKEIELVAYKCRNCGRIHYPFHDRCLACRSRQFDELSPQGRARLLTFTAIYNLPWGFDQRYLVIGVAEFENGVKAMGQIAIDESQLDGLKLGAPMTAAWAPVREQYGQKVYGLKFTPQAA